MEHLPFKVFDTSNARYNRFMESESTQGVSETLLINEKEAAQATRELLLFELDGELYAVAVCDVELVMKIPPVTAVPNAPSSIVGIFHLRGRVVVVLDLLKRMGLTRTTSLIPYYLFIAHQQKNYFGILVDHTRTVVRVRESEILPLDPMTAAHVPERYVLGTFLYHDKITHRSHSAKDSFMIEPISVDAAKLSEPVFSVRPVIILDLDVILNEADLRQSASSNVGSEVSSSQ